MFKRVLIANRGEIAVRVAATLQQMGIKAIAVYSDADRTALHVARADEAYALEGNAAVETYLRGERIVEIAKRCKADAIHPGYGFLSENPKFAGMCRDADITFIGPKPEVIQRVGNKVEAKRAFQAAGVPVAPGWSGEVVDAKRLMEEARRIGYPVLIKAAAGGGGKGMRLVEREADLGPALESAQREAGAAFGTTQVFFEKYITRARHVEFQVLGDEHGNVVHMFERECSIQRRHQKIVEETPSPALTPELRQMMGDAAVRAAKAVGYTNAGTVEFLVDGAGQFYFLEMNTRLQVEHPVTELTTGYDLVQLQLEIAAGAKLPFQQGDLSAHGHAMECRIYAEDAASGFLPSTGTIVAFEAPLGPGIRVDSGVAEGSDVTVHYDPMLAKLITFAEDRSRAIARMHWALNNLMVLGVTTNISFLQALLENEEFQAGNLHTHFLEEHKIREMSATAPPEAFVAAAVGLGNARSSRSATPSEVCPAGNSNPWTAGTGWRVA